MADDKHVPERWRSDYEADARWLEENPDRYGIEHDNQLHTDRKCLIEELGAAEQRIQELERELAKHEERNALTADVLCGGGSDFACGEGRRHPRSRFTDKAQARCMYCLTDELERRALIAERALRNRFKYWEAHLVLAKHELLAEGAILE